MKPADKMKNAEAFLEFLREMERAAVNKWLSLKFSLMIEEIEEDIQCAMEHEDYIGSLDKYL